MYKKRGQVSNNVGDIITLIIGVGVAALVLIFVGALSGAVYSEVESSIVDTNAGCGDGNAMCFIITPTGIENDNVSGAVLRSVTSGFSAIETSGQYLPIVVLAVVIFIVLGLVVGMGGGRQKYAGGAL